MMKKNQSLSVKKVIEESTRGIVESMLLLTVTDHHGKLRSIAIVS